MSGMSELPVVFVHKGDSWYLPYALNQALGCNQQQRVVLIGSGEKVWSRIDRMELSACEASPLARQFFRVYKHQSTNSEPFELFCWLRWFYLLSYMKMTCLKEVLYLDSDVLLYTSGASLVKSCHARLAKCAFFVPEQDHATMEWSASGHVSYWTAEALEQFCNFAVMSFVDKQFLSEYNRKWLWHQETKTPGGICDMTALYWFWKRNPDRIGNFSETHGAGVVDRAMGMSANRRDQEYCMRRGVKETIFEGVTPCFVEAPERGKAVVAALHFQGWTKDLIPFYYRGPGFPGKVFGDLLALWQFGKQRVLWRVRR